MEKICPARKGHSSVADPDLHIRGKEGRSKNKERGALPEPTRATQGGSTFHTFPFKTWRTVYMRNKK